MARSISPRPWAAARPTSLIAFGLLAADPELRREVVPKLASGKDFGSAKVVIFNGHQNPDTLLWGYIADRLGRGEVMAPFWKNGARRAGGGDHPR